MTTRRKSIGRGDEASGPVINALASQSMSRGQPKSELVHRRYGTPREGMYSRKVGGEYGSSVSNLQ